MTEAVEADAAEPAAPFPAPGAPADFAAWVRPHVRLMTLVAEREVGPADRDDVVQEALVRAWRRRRSYDERRGGPRGWLLAVLLDQARRHRRRHPWAARMAEAAEIPEGVGPYDDTDLADALDLDRAVRRLPRRQREVVVLYYLADLPVVQVAAVLGITEGTVKSQLHDARSALRAALGERGERRDGHR